MFKSFLSSADKNEFTTKLGIELKGTNILFSEENSLNNCPSFEYSLLEIGGLYFLKTCNLADHLNNTIIR